VKKSAEGSGGYWAHPISLLLYGVPNFQIRDELIKTVRYQTHRVQRYEIGGVSTLVTNVNAAHASTEAKIRACKRALRKKDLRLLVELVRQEPWFLLHPWVQKAMVRFKDHPRYKGKQGRQHRLKINPDTVRGFVDSIMESGRARSFGEAYGLLAQWASISEEHAKRLHRAASSDARSRAFVIVFPKERHITENEAQKIQELYPLLKPGQTVSFTCEIPSYGQVSVHFTGIDAGKPTKDFVVLLPSTLKISKG
jgi:hypothetical protein